MQPYQHCPYNACLDETYTADHRQLEKITTVYCLQKHFWLLGKTADY